MTSTSADNSPAPWLPWDGLGVHNAPGNRMPNALKEVVAQFDVAHRRRYQPMGGATFCNIFAWDVSRAMGAEIPHRIITASDDGSQSVVTELLVSDVIKWLDAKRGGWRESSAPEARAMANAGYPTVVTWANPDGPHGHIAWCMPSPPDEAQRVSQAGATCFENGSIHQGFGWDKMASLRWWTHD